MKAILSHPFSGALHWWFAAQSGAGGEQQSKRPRHPYYRALYDEVDENLDVALLFSVVFDELVLPAVDAPYPMFEGDARKQLRLAPLEITADWSLVFEATERLRPIEDDLRHDHVIAPLISGLSDEAQRLALLYATADVLLADAHAAPVLCAPGRRRVVLRLMELNVAPVSSGLAETIDAAGGLVEGIDAYAEVVGLSFASRTIDALSDVKWNEKQAMRPVK